VHEEVSNEWGLAVMAFLSWGTSESKERPVGAHDTDVDKPIMGP